MICTSIEQSKHLLELGLDPKSADMVWVRYAAGGYRLEVLHRELFERIMETDIAAWSLLALLEVIKSVFAYTTIAISGANKNLNFIRSKDLNYIWQHDIYGKTPLDAAYEMVCWLLKKNLIKKGDNDG